MSMLSSAESVMSCDMPFGFNADLTGEEKEGMGSMPFSSRTPVSLSSTPVRLDIDDKHGMGKRYEEFAIAYLPLRPSAV